MSRGWLRAVATLSSVAIVMSFGIDPTAADGNAGLHLHKTVDPLQLAINPGIRVTLAVDRSAAIPGDDLTYTSVVTNPSATFAMGGYINAEAVASADATVAYYWDQLEVCGQGCGNGAANPHWTPVATFEAGQPGYVPVTPPAVHTGMSFAAQSVSRPGVTYPTTGDPVLGTVMNPKATATWTYLSKVVLTPAQVAVLSDPAQVTNIRNVLHFEVTIRNSSAAQPYTDPEEFSSPFTTTSNPGAIRNVTVTFTMPDGSTVAVGPAQVPALGTLSPGGSVTATAHYKVPVPAARGAGETDARYAMRLGGLDGSALIATAVAAGSGFSGNVYATSPAVTTVEYVPIVTIVKAGPPEINAGDTETNPLTLINGGGAPASSLAVVDSVPGGTNGTVSPVPSSLAPGASASATANFPVPISQAEGDLTDTASVTWNDANGNAYGPLTSSFTTKVHNLLFSATLTLAPANAGPNPPGTTQTLTATLLDRSGNPIPNQTVRFDITGANPGTGTATTNASGVAEFTYTGTNAGNDVAQATVTAPGLTLTSNTASISWGRPVQPIVTTQVEGNFFPNPNNTCTFGAGPTSTPAFSQTFPDILFNPPPSSVPHNISSVNQSTRPFTDLTVDVNGNYNGQIVAQGKGMQAGVESLSNFYAVFTGSFIATQAGDVTFTILHDDGYILGVGGGATRVNGDLEGNPPATTPFQGYGVVAGWNQAAGSQPGTATVHFPAAGTYPYELDYTECGGGPLFLVLETAQFIAQTDPLSIYVGYADGLRAGGSVFPFPWEGSPGVTFIGGCTFDAGALRFDNSGDTDITFDKVTVDIPGAAHFDLWPANLVVPAHRILILTQTGCYNFDSSDYSSAGCGGNNNVLPLVNVTRAGVTTTYTDTHQILNTRGFDTACLGNESTPWQRIAGQASTINTPLPPGAVLTISPFTVAGALLGQTQALTVSAMDAAGNPVANLPVTLQVIGPNARTLTATTLSTGLAAFSYVGAASGTDHIQASAFIGGLRAISNLGSVTWSAPAGGGPNPSPNPDPNAPPPPSITAPSPADGTVVTKPVSVNATITPPSGQTITSWRVFYQALDPGPVVVIASGTTALPSPLAIFDPTVLPNDTYGITVEATASNGAVQDLTSTVTVLGNLKPGRFVTTFQDLSASVNGFQMEVKRTYDSFDKSQGDFGVGWKVSLANFRVAPNRTLGAAGWTMYNKQCFIGLCITGYKNSAPRFVTVTFPDQHTEVFDFTPPGGTNLFWECTPIFTARASTGTTSTLEPLDDTGCSYVGDGNIYGTGGGLYDPHRFRLTTLDGHVYVLNRTSGLESVTDAAGNSLTVSAAGVISSSGPSIAFTRDAQGRITQIAGPGGAAVTYAYDSNGDLNLTTDAAGGRTTYSYAAAHRLTGFAGPGAPQLTLEYDPAGRLVSVTDATGAKTIIANDVGAQTQVITDPNGEVFVLTLDDRGDVLTHTQVAGGTSFTTTRTYDSVGHVLTTTDPAGARSEATYDANGDLTSLTDPSGRKMVMTYGSRGELLSFADPAGKVTSYVYDSRLVLTSITYPDGTAETFTHNSAGEMTSRHDRRGSTSNYAYDANGNLTSMTDPLGRAMTYGYDALGRLVSETNPAGATTTYTYDAVGRLLSRTDALGGKVTMAYDSLGRQSSVTDALGHTTTQAYDAAGRLTRKVDPLGGATSFTYDANGHQLTKTLPDGGVVTSTYDAHGRLARQADQLGRSTTYTYDADGRQASVTSASGAVTTYAYDASGRPVTITVAGAAQALTYDATGRLATVTNAAGGVERYTYDSLGNQTRIIDRLGRTTSFTYNAAGDLLTTTDPLGNVTSQTYDAAGEVASVTDGSGRTVSFAYDAAGNRTTVTDAAGHVTTSQYDKLDRLVKTTSAAGVATTYEYDAASERVAMVDGAGGRTTFTYDAGGRISSTTDPLGHTTSYTNDPIGRITGLTDALGARVSYSYDLAGQLVSITDPLGHVTSFTHDAGGGVASRTSQATGTTAWQHDSLGRVTALTNARGQITRFTYDSLGDLTAITAPDYSVQQTFDAAQQRTSFTDPGGTTTYTYDAAGRPTAIAAPSGTLGYSYDGAGRRTAMTLPGGITVSSTYDSAGFLASVSANGLTTSYTHDADGRIATVDRGTVKSAYTYDAAGRQTSISHTAGATTLDSYSYTLDSAGHRIAVATAAGRESYTYDAAGRLTSVTYPDGTSATYAYDAAGNRTSQTIGGATTGYTYDAAGRLTAVGGSAITYDADGQVTGVGADRFGYDSAGRLTSATVGGTSYANVYDGDGVRVRATAGATSTSYVVDRTGDVPQVVSDGTTSYVRDNSGAILSETTAAGTQIPLSDGLGSIRRLVDSGGSSVATAAYDAFGARLSGTGSVGAFGFTGEAADPTGLIFLRARHYNPSWGRFMSPDAAAIGASGTVGANRYVYTGDDPVNRTDPTGRFAAELAIEEEEETAVADAALPPASKAIYYVIAVVVLALLGIAATGCFYFHAWICHALQNPPRPGDKPHPGPGTTTFEPDAQTDALQKQAATQQAAEQSKADQCEATDPLAPVNDPASPCRAPGLKIFFPGGDTPATTMHDLTAIAGHVLWGYLVKTPGLPDKFRSWYDSPTYRAQDASNPCFQRPQGTVCDEYPFFKTIYGGPFNNPQPSLAVTSRTEGNTQGAHIKNFYYDAKCGLVDYDVIRGGYFVIPSPLAPKTFWICNP